MTNTFLILLPIALFLVMLMGLSLWAERAGRRNRFAGEYFLGDRSLKGFVLAMTLVATYGSVSSFVSGPGLAWQLGLGWVVFAAPQIIAGFLILGVAGKKMAVVSRAAGALTVIDMIRARYGDGRGGRTLAALLAVLMLVFFTTMMIGQFIGGAQIFSKAAGVSYGWGLVLFGAVTVLYTAFGGFRAVAVTDTACAVLMLVGMGALGWNILETGGGLAQVMANVAAAAPRGAGSEGVLLSPTSGGALATSLLLSAWVLVGLRHARVAPVGRALHELPPLLRPASGHDRLDRRLWCAHDRHDRDGRLCPRYARRASLRDGRHDGRRDALPDRQLHGSRNGGRDAHRPSGRHDVDGEFASSRGRLRHHEGPRALSPPRGGPQRGQASHDDEAHDGGARTPCADSGARAS